MPAMKRFVIVGLFAAGCATPKTAPQTPVQPPLAHPVPEVADDAKLTKDQCSEMVDHYFEVFIASKPSDEDIAKAQEGRDAKKTDDSLAECIQDANGKFYKCVLAATTPEAVDACAP